MFEIFDEDAYTDAARRADNLLLRQRQAREQKSQRDTVRLGSTNMSWVLVDDRELKDEKAMRDLGALDRAQRQQFVEGSVMDDASAQKWNDWADGRIAEALKKFDRELTQVHNQLVGDIEAEADMLLAKITELTEKVSALTTQVAVLEAMARGEVRQLTKGKTCDAA